MIQSIISTEVLTTVGKHRELMYNTMENKQKKGGFQATTEKKSIINMICNNWMQKKKRKTETFILLLLPLNGLSRKKKYPRRLNVFNLLTQDTREWHRAASGDGQVGNWEEVPPCGRHGTGCPGWWAQPHAARAQGVLGHHS